MMMMMEKEDSLDDEDDLVFSEQGDNHSFSHAFAIIFAQTWFSSLSLEDHDDD